ncbi:MAG: hypothetical protein ACLFR7_09500 [Opitutales bacterium]
MSQPPSGTELVGDLRPFLRHLVSITGPRALEWYNRPDLAVERKADRTVVTEVDRRLEVLLRAEIAKEFPDHGVIVAGTDAAFRTFGSLRLWERVLRDHVGIAPAVGCDPEAAYCRALLRRGPNASVLSVLELLGHGGVSHLTVHEAVPGMDDVHLQVDLKPHEARSLVLGAELEGRRLAYCTSELLATHGAKTRWKLHGAPGTRGELAFFGRTDLVLGGERKTTEQGTDGMDRVRYQHGLEPLTLEFLEG